MKPSDDPELFEPKPRMGEFLAWVAVSSAIMALLYVGLTPRNAALMAAGHDIWKPETIVDRYIPFTPGMVWAYYTYFPLLFSPMIVESRHRLWLYEGAMGAIAGAVVGALFFYFLPSRVDQPELHHLSGVSYRALQVMFDMDRGFHAFPSLHVAFSVYTANFWRERMPRYWHVPGIIALFVTLSTVMCKRHYFIDIPGGLVVGWAMGRFASYAGPKAARWMAWAK